MDPVLSLLSGIAPLVYLLSALVAHKARDTQLAMAAVRPAAAIAVGLSLAAAVGVAVVGPSVSPLLGYGGWGLQLRVDALSATMFVLIASVGAIVLRFSRNYLAGEPNQSAFFRDVSMTLAAVLMLVLAGNLGQLVLAWTATSLSLHRLLQFFRHRPAAREAARKKFFVARASDFFIIAGAVTLSMATSTADIGAIAVVAREAVATESVSPLLAVSAVFMVLAAATKSAAFPTHAWLLDVMEAPTPVSALLHAGLINAGGFLLIRLSDVILASPTALALLCGVGLVTALFGSLVSATQPRVKRALAFSTVGQMGFMLLQCGLGSFTSAAVHLVVHSVYKAHAFLGAGSSVEAPSARASVSRRPALHWVGCVFAAMLLVLGAGAVLGFSPDHEPGAFVLGAVIAFSLAHLLLVVSAERDLGLLLIATATSAVLALGYFALQLAAHLAFDSTVANAASLPGGVMAVGFVGLAAFASVSAAHWGLSRLARRPSMARLYVALKNGLYVEPYFERLAR